MKECIRMLMVMARATVLAFRKGQNPPVIRVRPDKWHGLDEHHCYLNATIDSVSESGAWFCAQVANELVHLYISGSDIYSLKFAHKYITLRAKRVSVFIEYNKRNNDAIISRAMEKGAAQMALQMEQLQTIACASCRAQDEHSAQQKQRSLASVMSMPENTVQEADAKAYAIISLMGDHRHIAANSLLCRKFRDVYDRAHKNHGTEL